MNMNISSKLQVFDQTFMNNKAGNASKSTGKPESDKKTNALDVSAYKPNSISAANEEKLSDKAKELLSQIREKYGDYDIFVADSEENMQELSDSGSKEFSVVFSRDELEKMADDEDYAGERMDAIEKSVEMCKRIANEQGFVSAGEDTEGAKGIINKISVTVGDNGNMKIFAEVEKLNESQRDRIEKARAKNAEAKKDEVKKAETKKADDKKNPYGKEDASTVKRTTIEADSEEDFLKKLSEIDWSKVAAASSGDKFNFTV